MIDTRTVTLNHVVETKQIVELPLNGCDHADLVLLAPAWRREPPTIPATWGTRSESCSTFVDPSTRFLCPSRLKFFAHYLHPDKSAPELFVNEIGVAPTHRRQGSPDAS